jgi:hypothetical protein
MLLMGFVIFREFISRSSASREPGRPRILGDRRSRSETPGDLYDGLGKLDY